MPNVSGESTRTLPARVRARRFRRRAALEPKNIASPLRPINPGSTLAQQDAKRPILSNARPPSSREDGAQVVDQARLLFHHTHGDGPALLAIHGGLGFDHTYLRPGLDPLGDQCALVFADLRGNGRSPRPGTAKEWSALGPDVWCADMDRLRAHLGHERWMVFGHSVGGTIAMEYALRYPRRVAGLILCGGFAVFDFAAHVGSHLASLDDAAAQATFTRLFTREVADDDALKQGFGTVFHHYFHDATVAGVMKSAFDSIVFSAAAFNASGGYQASVDLRSRLAEIGCPCLVLCGGEDWIAPVLEAGGQLTRGIPNSTLAVVPSAGHMPFLERPEETLTAIRAWIASIE